MPNLIYYPSGFKPSFEINGYYLDEEGYYHYWNCGSYAKIHIITIFKYPEQQNLLPYLSTGISDFLFCESITIPYSWLEHISVKLYIVLNQMRKDEHWQKR